MNPTNDAPAQSSDVDGVLRLFHGITDRVSDILRSNTDWSWSGERESQYRVDVDIDAVCLSILHGAGFAVLSEESGVTAIDGSRLGDAPGALVVVDPLDGSTNASLGLPWCATALCLVVNGRPEVAHVANLRTGDRFDAIRGRGASRNGRAMSVAAPVGLDEAIIAINARPPEGFAPRQFRAMGATALDIVSVADGAAGGFDGYIDFDDDRIGVWDYLAAVMIVEEAGGVVVDALGRPLVTLDPRSRRRPIAASTAGLVTELLAVG